MNAIDREKLRGWLAEQVAEKWRAERECDDRLPLTGLIYSGEAQALKKVIASLDCGDFDRPDSVVVTREQMRRRCGATRTELIGFCEECMIFLCPFSPVKEAKRDE